MENIHHADYGQWIFSTNSFRRSSMTTLAAKLKALRAENGMSQDQFSEALGEKPSSIRDIETGRKRLNDEFLRKLIDRFSVDLNWLFDVPGFEGRSSLILPPDRTRPAHGDLTWDGKEYAFVRQVDLAVSAGPGIVSTDPADSSGMGLPVKWFHQAGLNSDLCVLVRVKGDSMSPTIGDGAHILLDLGEKQLTRPAIFAFGLDGEAFVKRLVPSDPDAKGRPRSVAVLADNPSYPPIILLGAQLAGLRVVGRVRAVFAAL